MNFRDHLVAQFDTVHYSPTLHRCKHFRISAKVYTKHSIIVLLYQSYDDYMSFLCGIDGSNPTVLNYTGQNCWTYNSTVYGPDLNLPSITIARLNQSRVVQRTIQNIAGNEPYNVGFSAPYGTSMKVSLNHFSLGSGERQVLSVIFNATSNSSATSYGRIGLYGNQGHVVNIPVAVIFKIL
ncbi:hypothetical protein VNO80_11298 [Phaseolus coccineus]|uniref:Subtilisin-like protease fibronectin type-III domain-containing protein n=1 Tax=Phaseolus coccineus TaxID=3886 RepID=A0AAN9NEY9_PHACN